MLGTMTDSDSTSFERAADAAARLCQAYFTGLILTLVSQRSTAVAAEFVEAFFRRKQREQFLPGLEKLGLTGLPDAVACAHYHYLSNHLGGVGVEFMPESDTKAWIRYPPPRWAWTGTAICGIPTEVSRGMLRGWHARNGISLGNPRLGFVCTKQTVDGVPGLEGYYIDHGVELEPQDRLQFAPHEEAPPFDPAQAPQVPTGDWPAVRLAKAHRNYGMDYVKTALQVLAEQRGDDEARFLGGRTGRLIGMQLVEEMRGPLGIEACDVGAAAGLLAALCEAMGDEAEVRAVDGGVTVETAGWRLTRGVALAPGAVAAWNEVWVGLALATNRFLELDVERWPAESGGWSWRLSDRSAETR